jgi:hypothetical protein
MPIMDRKYVALICAVLLLVTGCEEDNTTQPTRFTAEEPFVAEVGIGTRTRVRLIGVNGNVEINGDAGAAAISITAMKSVESDSYEDAEAHLADLEIGVATTESEIVVRTDQPDTTDGREYKVDYTIVLPKDFAVIVTNVNGEVLVGSIAGDVIVDVTNGRIHTTAIEGQARLRTANGDIDASVKLPTGGRTLLRTVNGDIALEIPRDTSATLTASVANGRVEVRDLELSNVVQTPTSIRSGAVQRGPNPHGDPGGSRIRRGRPRIGLSEW